jgi:hypothetical protein
VEALQDIIMLAGCDALSLHHAKRDELVARLAIFIAVDRKRAAYEQ